MVGRRAQLDALREAYEDTRGGRPRTVLVRGEAGIGKTRLVTEFLAEASTQQLDGRPVVVAVGQCVDLGPIGAPFGPVRRLLRDLHTAVGADTLRAAAGSSAAIASLAALVPGIADTAGDPDEAAGEFAEAIEVLLERLSRERQVIVVIEDLQWADAATLVLLKTLASTLRGRHLLILATYRSDEVDRFHPLRPVLGELDRTRAIIRVDIEPLSPDEVADQVAQLASREFGPRDIDTLAERSGGIPFLVEELVDIGGGGLPETLRELVLARYARLSDDGQSAVRAMAAGGLHVDHDVLAAASTLDDRALDAAIREAIDARVILADGAGYAFRHALTREAVEREMLPSENVRVHRRYAEHLRDHRADSLDDATAIAEHWLAARDLTAAFDATVAALRSSRARYSPATSAKLAERLTELWDQVPDAAARAGTTLAELHLDAALAWHDLGDAPRALRSANEGLAVCGDDPLTRAALLRQRFVQSYNAEHRSRQEDLEAATAILEGVDDPRARALQSRVLSNIAMGGGPEAGERADRAIALAEEAGDDAALAIALTIKAWRIAEDEDDEPRALEPLERAVALPVSPAVRAYAGDALLDLLTGLGRWDEAAVVGEQHYADAVRAGIERGSGASIAYSLARALFATGRPDEARRFAGRARRLVDRTARPSVLRLLATHYTWNDQPAARRELLDLEQAAIDEAIRAHPEKQGTWVVERADALVSLRALGAAPPDDAWESAVAATLQVALEHRSPAVRRVASLSAAMLLASRTAPPDERHERLAAAVDAWQRRGLSPVSALFVRAMLADASDRPADDRVAAWRVVVDDVAFDALPVWHRHVARTSLAAAQISVGSRGEAETLLREVTTAAPRQGVMRVARWAVELAAMAGIDADDGPRGETPPDAVGDAVAGLTPRERQVLELVAQGLTNAQIGQRLFISPKTASVHVSAILAKVGAANRAEAAALYAAAT